MSLELFELEAPAAGTAVSADVGGRSAAAPYDGAGAYRCSSEEDCAEQVRVLRFVEAQGNEGATLAEIEAALKLDGFEVSLFRLAAVVEWMIGRDALLKKATALRWGVGTAVVVATYFPKRVEPQISQRAQIPEGGT